MFINIHTQFFVCLFCKEIFLGLCECVLITICVFNGTILKKVVRNNLDVLYTKLRDSGFKVPTTLNKLNKLLRN